MLYFKYILQPLVFQVFAIAFFFFVRYQNCFHGVNLSNLRDEALNEYLRQPIVDTFDIEICLAKSIRHTLDFTTASEEDLHLLGEVVTSLSAFARMVTSLSAFARIVGY